MPKATSEVLARSNEPGRNSRGLTVQQALNPRQSSRRDTSNEAGVRGLSVTGRASATR